VLVPVVVTARPVLDGIVVAARPVVGVVGPIVGVVGCVVPAASSRSSSRAVAASEPEPDGCHGGAPAGSW
jgi:hypothetical protein